MQKNKSMLSLGLFLATAILAGWFLAGCADKEKPLKYSTIHEAAEKGDLEDVKNHLCRGTAVNARNEWGLTPLHAAVASNQIKVAEFLIKKGAEINAEFSGRGYRRDYTPLEIAAEEDHIEMVKLLIRNGAKVNVDAIGKMLDKGHTEVALDMAKKVDVKGEEGKEILRGLAHWPSSKKGTMEIAEILIKKANVEALTSALFTAVDAGNAEIAELLLKHGADVKGEFNLLHVVFGTYGTTPAPKSINLVKVLLKYGVDVNAKTDDGKTPLHKLIINRDWLT